MYKAPYEDLHFNLTKNLAFDQICALPDYQDVNEELLGAILSEAGKFAESVMARLNKRGDKEGSVLNPTSFEVKTPPGFKECYSAYSEAGWNAVPFATEYGGQGLPFCLSMALQELWQSSNMAFALCPLLNQGAVELLTEVGSDKLKNLYLRNLISGTWTGTMNLTESQAGSDVGAVKTKAVRVEGSDHYKITGQKIFITYGEHDFTPNIIHMVLARTPTAPEGIKGISLFLVPKFMVKDDGSLGARNDLKCVSLEHKLGIHASPTAVMSYGDQGGAIGYLIGEENRGIEYMFIMMNNARLGVGIQGVSIAERAYQQALHYAKDRVQSKSLSEPQKGPAAIIQHEDIRRMLLEMRAQIEAARSLYLYAGFHMDIARKSADAQHKTAAQKRADFLTPIIKAWGTDIGCEVSSLGIQIHGGMGYIEETGAAQHFRDSRIAPIYEGTNGIQANDLLFRKTLRDNGAEAMVFLSEINDQINHTSKNSALYDFSQNLKAASQELDSVTKTLLSLGAEKKLSQCAFSAYAYLSFWGIVSGGFMMLKSGLSAEQALVAENSNEFYKAKIQLAKVYGSSILPKTKTLSLVIGSASEQMNQFKVDWF